MRNTKKYLRTGHCNSLTDLISVMTLMSLLKVGNSSLTWKPYIKCVSTCLFQIPKSRWNFTRLRTLTMELLKEMMNRLIHVEEVTNGMRRFNYFPNQNFTALMGFLKTTRNV
jgi:hypothetical protein